MMEGLNIASFNVNGLNIPSKRRAIFQEIRRLNIDLCCLQETHGSTDTINLWQTEWGGKLLHANGQQNSRGVAILLKRSLQCKIQKQMEQQDGRILLVDIEIQGTTFTIGSLYAPTQDRPAEQASFIDKLEDSLENMNSTNTILAGDLNCFLDPALDRNVTTTLSNTNLYRDRLRALLEERLLCDIWRIRHPNKREYTFRRGQYASRLDYLLTSDHLSETVKSVKIHHGPHSDHSLITLKMGQNTAGRGPGLWRFDPYLLSDTSFISQMTDFLCEWQAPEELSHPTVVWEWLKYEIKKVVVSYQERNKSATAQAIKDLREELQGLCERQDMENQGDESVGIRIESIKRELREIEEEASNKIIFRSKCKWAKLGEKPTKYFLNLEKQRSRDNMLATVITTNGKEIRDQKDILEECRLFYETLYSENKDDLSSIEHLMDSIRDLPHPILSDISKHQLDAPVSIEELKGALSKMNKGKSPGSDGIPPEFYVAFWAPLAPFLFNSLSQSFREGILSSGQRRGVITLIPKKDVDRRSIANWRPITLLNCDYKILAKAVALRLQRHISPLIHPDQTGFMQARCIGDNIRVVEDAINTINSNCQGGLVVALDFSKAFDSVRWEMIYAALRFFNFGEPFIDMIRLLFTDIESSILNAGTTSKAFKPSRGIRQGCPASPYLFNMVVEILALLIRDHQDIRGLKMHDREIKLSQFADDLTCFIENRQSLTPLMDTLDQFTKWSGLKINMDKSHVIYPMGSREEISHIHNFSIREETKILGIWFFAHGDPGKSYVRNFKPILSKARQICNSWTNRSLSIKGKVTVANSLITSLFQYTCSYIHTPPEVFKELRKIITAFLWDTRKPKVAYDTLTLPVAEGGLGLFDLQTRTHAALIQGIRRILHEPRLGPAAFLRQILGITDLKEYFRTKPRQIPTAIKTLPYYNSMFKLWFKLHHFFPLDETSVRQEALWGNKWITNIKGPIQNEAWANRGVLIIQDICHQSEDRLLSHLEMNEKHNVKCTFLDMLALRLSIPLQWRESLSKNWNRPNIFPGGPTVVLTEGQAPIDISNLSSKKAYSALIAAKKIENTAFHRWRRHDHATAIGGWDEWERTCKRIYQTTMETKMHSFQFKILHAITPCKKFLRRLCIVDDDRCDNCGVTDDLFHFFFHCSMVQNLWSSVCRWSASQAHIPLSTITPKEVVVGVDDVSPRGRIINFLLLHFRYFVHRQRLFHNNKFELTHWLAELKSRLRTLERNLKLDGKSHLFKKWEFVLNTLG